MALDVPVYVESLRSPNDASLLAVFPLHVIASFLLFAAFAVYVNQASKVVEGSSFFFFPFFLFFFFDGHYFTCAFASSSATWNDAFTSSVSSLPQTNKSYIELSNMYAHNSVKIVRMAERMHALYWALVTATGAFLLLVAAACTSCWEQRSASVADFGAFSHTRVFLIQGWYSVAALCLLAGCFLLVTCLLQVCAPSSLKK